MVLLRRAQHGGELARHDQDDADAVDRPPRLRALAQQPVLRRQVAAALPDPGIDAGGVGVEQLARLGRRGGEQALGRRGEAELAQATVETDRALAQQLGQASDRGAAGQLHLKEAVVGVQPAERRGGVARRAGGDRRDAGAIEAHPRGFRQPGQGRLARAAGAPAAAQPEGKRHHGDDEQEQHDGDGAQYAARAGGGHAAQSTQ